MMPSSPMRGSRRPVSALSVDVVVAVIERIDVLLIERYGVAQGTGEVHGASGVLAHDGGLDRLKRPAADRGHPVRAHQRGGGAMAGERLDDAAADLLVADQREWAQGDLAAELVGDRGHHARDRLPPAPPPRSPTPLGGGGV